MLTVHLFIFFHVYAVYVKIYRLIWMKCPGSVARGSWSELYLIIVHIMDIGRS